MRRWGRSSVKAGVLAGVLAAGCGGSGDDAAAGDDGSETVGDGDGDGDGDSTGDGDGDSSDVSCEAQPNQLTIATTAGPVTGAAVDELPEITRFLAIPYAAPPIGPLRFRPPQPPTPWTEPRDASAWGPKCVQLTDADASASEGDEDCLQLNVWTPQACTGADRPVLLFIHGGGNSVGSAVEPLYDGAKLAAAADAVVVTINYRLGALGWLAVPALDDEDPDGVSGNYGLRDQIAALDWVVANIARFGGDPARITVFGESAGAVNTCALITTPGAAGKLAGAIVQSGTCNQAGRAQLTPLGDQLVANAGCSDAADVATCLRAIPAAALVALAPTGYPSVSGISRGWGPHVDGVVLPASPIDTLAAGIDLPLVVGSNRDETAKDAPPNLDEATYTSLIQATFMQFAPQVLAAYPVADYASPSAAWAALTADFKFICNARRAAVASSSGGAPTWRYQFSYDAYTTVGQVPQVAFHGLELVYLFGNYANLVEGFDYPPNPDDLAMQATMQARWAAFAATGAFDGPTYVVGEDPYLELDEPVGTGAGLRTEQCDFWDQLF